MRTPVAAIVAVGLGSGCTYGPYTFTCIDDASCGPSGKCESGGGLCSFPDPRCPGGRSYGSLSGEVSGQCVTPDAPLACYGTAPISICFATPPTGVQTYSGTIDTTSSALCATNVVSGGSNFCVLAAGTITVAGPLLRATGAKPLVLLATDSITTDALIDVSSRRGMNPEAGAGADPAECARMVDTPPTKGGGGAGGSFAGPGGDGAVSANGGSTGGMPGTPLPPTSIALRGGCRGQDGEGQNKGAGGHGGGAVLLIAASITLNEDIVAGGEGGEAGAMNTSGGGGGGAGGMIWLDAPTVVSFSADSIAANGGAGGEGSGVNQPGQPGADGTGVTAAPGGSVLSSGGDGGRGSAGPAGAPGATGGPGVVANGIPGGGGGGGGGAGLVRTRQGVNLASKVSPAVTAP